MKKIIIAAMLVFAGINFATAQDTQFGVQAGYTNVKSRSSSSVSSGVSSENFSGFYVGALADFQISENFHIQPEVNYALAEDNNFLFIPVLAQYYIADSGFYLQGGPQATLYLEDTMDILNTFGLDLAFGIGYNINENFFLQARYSFELTNRFNELPRGLSEQLGDIDINSGIDLFTIGVGYKF